MPELRRYVDHRPYPAPPARLDDLTGLTSGMVELPVTIDWGPGRSYDLGQDTDRRVVYERVLREAASTGEVCRYVNGQALLDVWGRLWLPRRVRSSWEERFPEFGLGGLARGGAARIYWPHRSGSSQPTILFSLGEAARDPQAYGHER